MERYKLQETTYYMDGYSPDFKVIDTTIPIEDVEREDGAVAYLNMDEESATDIVKAINNHAESTTIKEIAQLDVLILTDGEDVPSTENIYKCNDCGWRFTGTCERYGHGYDEETVDTPNFCPMCGKKIED